MKQKDQYHKRRRLTCGDRKLAQTIRQLRKERGLTQEKLAEELSLNISYIAYIETGKRGLSLPVVFKIARVFGVKVKQLFDF